MCELWRETKDLSYNPCNYYWFPSNYFNFISDTIISSRQFLNLQGTSEGVHYSPNSERIGEGKAN